MEQEIWKTAQYIFEDGHKEVFEKYQVSSLGRVKSLNYRNTGKEGLLSQGTITAKDGSIFYMVHISKDKKTYSLNVHRLILSSFKESEFFEGAVCDHIEARSETCCNHVDNLRWFTPSQNVSTEQCRDAKSIALTNRPDLSKKVKVTFPDGSQKIFDSARDANRSLGLPSRCAANCIKYQDGYYKRLDLHFEYL